MADEVTVPDGYKLIDSLPDGYSLLESMPVADDVSKYNDSIFGRLSAKVDEIPILKTIADIGQKFTGGAAKAIPETVELGAALLNAMNYSDRSKGVAQKFKEGMEAVEPVTKPVKEFVGARTGTPKGIVEEIADKAGSFVNPVALLSKGNLLVKGGALIDALGGGAAIQAIDEIIPDSSPETKAGLGLLAGLLGGNISTAGKSAKTAVFGASENALKDSAERNVGKYLKKEAKLSKKDLEQAIAQNASKQESSDIAEKLNQLKTTAEITDNPVMATIELTSATSNPKYGELADKRGKLREALLDDAGLDVANAKSDLEVGANVRAKTQAEKEAAIKAYQELYKDIDPNGVTRIPYSKVLQTTKKQEKLLASPASGNPLPLEKNTKGLIEALMESTSPAMVEERLMLTPMGRAQLRGVPPRQKQKILKEQSEKATINYLSNMRSNAMNARDLAKVNSQKNLLTEIRKSIDDTIEQAAIKNEGVTPEQVIKWREANAAFQDTKQTFDNNALMRYSVLNEQVTPDRIVQAIFNSDMEGVKNLKKVIGADDPLMIEVKRSVASKLSQAGRGRGNGPEITLGGIRSMLKGREATIQELFGEDHLRRLKRLEEDLRSQDRVTARGRAASRGGAQTRQLLTTSDVISEALMKGVPIPILDSIPGSRNIRSLLSGMSEGKRKEAIHTALFQAAMNPQSAKTMIEKADENRVLKVGQEIFSNLLGSSTATME